jgi:predicted RNA methylase
MSAADRLVAKKGFLSQADRKKRLGQYLTGVGLGRVLGALARAAKASTILDPMEGTGDLLAACLGLGAKPDILAGIEIDPIAFGQAKNRLPEGAHRLGNAFDAKLIAKLPVHEWDLVIANPPYVRYQSMASAAGLDDWLPSAVEIRNTLIASIEHLSALDEEDKRLFVELTAGYSGLADLAVPAWILCAGLVAVGGRLALVVPESWLSRDYASVVHYLLLRWFQVEYIVEDEHAAWFEDAQVKTTLLVARRIPRRESAFDWRDEQYVHARISGDASGAAGPIARIFPNSSRQEEAFASAAAQTLASSRARRDALYSLTPAPIAGMSRSLRGAAQRQKWFAKVGEVASASPHGAEVPASVAAWVSRNRGKSHFIPLESLGVVVGQGLRTGANGFFYASLVSQSNRQAVIEPDGVPDTTTVKVPTSCLVPTLRRQSELPKGFQVRKRNLRGRTLDLRSLALPADLANGGPRAKAHYNAMPKELAAFVQHAGAANFGTYNAPKKIQLLTAVAPNIRRGVAANGTPPRYWYMLPDFAPRHLPKLCVPRINSGNIKAVLVAETGILVDANFSTMNIAPGASISAHAALALLNSSWCLAVLEYGASVMGGGALKVEATHLRRLPVPRLSPAQWKKLDVLGKHLAKDGSGLLAINCLVASGVLGRKVSDKEVASLEELAIQGKTRRGGHKNKGKRNDDRI